MIQLLHLFHLNLGAINIIMGLLKAFYYNKIIYLYTLLYAFLYGSLGPQHCVCVVDVRKSPMYIYKDTQCFTDCNIKIWLNIKFYTYLYAYLYGSMGTQHCICVVDVRKITTHIYTDTQCFTDQWGHYFTLVTVI
jgi:hypothetical protein